MLLNKTNKLVWFVKLIIKAKQITFEDINQARVNNIDMSGGLKWSKRTFNILEVLKSECFRKEFAKSKTNNNNNNL